jgi:hypothetical protein
MGADKAASAAPVADPFVKSPDGRTLFYPFGPSWHGYVVASTDRERALRAAMERGREIGKRLAPLVPILAGLLLFPTYYFFFSRPFLAFGWLIFLVPLLVASDHAFRRYRLRPLLAGLESVVGPKEDRRRRTFTALIFMLIGMTVVAWSTLWLYQRRIGELPEAPRTTTYYDGISLALFLALFAGTILCLCLLGWKRATTRSGEHKILITLLVCTAIDFACIYYIVTNFMNPHPSVIVSRETLTCKWTVPWPDVTDLDLTDSRGGKRYARLQIGPKPEISLRLSGSGGKRCEISGLNEDYAVVYQTIQTAWLGSKRRPRNKE